MLAYRELSSNNTHRREKHRKRPYFRLRYVALALILGWALFQYLHVERPQLVQLHAQQQQLQSQYSHLKKQAQQLQEEKEQFTNKSFVEKYAENHFGLTMPNQVPFNLPNQGQHG